MKESQRRSRCVSFDSLVDISLAFPLQKVNEVWAGLGYYRRAKFLHEGESETRRGVSFDSLVDLWAGLGYYRRAKFLHEGAKKVVEKHKGEVITLYTPLFFFHKIPIPSMHDPP